MKHILLLTTAATLFGATQFCFAQKEPVGLSPAPIGPGATPATPESPATSPPRTSRKSSPAAGNATLSSAGLSGTTFFTTGSRGDAIPPVVIRFSQPDPKTSATLEEDLFVMARVISRTLERGQADNIDYKLNVPMLLTGSGRSVRPMYIEGVGPLFMIKVNFALLPPAKAEEKATNATPADTEWDAAHQEVFGPAEGSDEYLARSSRYSGEKVELLKKELTGALKNAAKMRGLKPDEFVNIAAFGHATSQRMKSGAAPDRSGGFATAEAAFETARAVSSSKGSVLTLRAKKSDIDAFANGKLDDEAFKAKVMMTAYFGSGSGITSINSWIQESTSRILR
jgi:hypothetical protein